MGQMPNDNGAFVSRYNKVNHVYFIESQILQKVRIGVTANIASRINTLRLASPDKNLRLLGYISAPYKDACKIELVLHSYFKSFQSHGEWFEATGDVLGFARRFNSNHNLPQKDYQSLLDENNNRRIGGKEPR